MNAYFDTNHLAGLLILTTMSAWGMMELSVPSHSEKEPPRSAASAGGWPC